MKGSSSRPSSTVPASTENSPTQPLLIETLLNNWTTTSLHSRLSHISLGCEILLRKSAYLEPILTLMAGCERRTTLQGPAQVVSLLHSQISELELICKTLKIACDQYLSQMRE